MEKKGFLGIDVSKGYADFLLLDNNSQVMEEAFMLHDNKSGRQKLKELICNWQQSGLEELWCGVESTGGYENNWYSYLKSFARTDIPGLKDCKVCVCRINPRGVKAVSDAALKRTITDAVSAENIACYLIRFPEKLDYGLSGKVVDEGYTDGRDHLNIIRMQIKQKVQMGNQLEKLLYQNYAEILVYCRHGAPVWLLNMLIKYPSAAAVLRAGVARLSAIRGITVDKARSILTKAKENQHDVSSQNERLIKFLVKEILHKLTLIKDEKIYLSELYGGAEEVKLLSSIPGVGIDSAVILSLEIEDVSRFETAKKMMSFFGIHPRFKQSGDGNWGSHMSKTGRGDVRAVLYMVSLSAIRCNPPMKKLYASFRAKGMTHYAAMGVVMHKMLRICYGILKNKTMYSAATDEKNQEKSAEKQKANELKDKKLKKGKELKRSRFQTETTDAPISGQRERKIKKQVASQTSA